MMIRELKKDYPDLRGFRIHIIEENPDHLLQKLEEHDFEVIIIHGKEIQDEETFFTIFSRALNFPDYFGHNWNAWDECLYDFGEQIDTEKIALIWEDADDTMHADPQTFLSAVCDLRELSIRVTSRHNDNDPKVQQFEIFLAGQWE